MRQSIVDETLVSRQQWYHQNMNKAGGERRQPCLVAGAGPDEKEIESQTSFSGYPFIVVRALCVSIPASIPFIVKPFFRCTG